MCCVDLGRPPRLVSVPEMLTAEAGPCDQQERVVVGEGFEEKA